jgi:hypothetical protein
MFVQVIDIFDHPALGGAGEAQIVDHRQVLDVFAQPHPARVRADRQLVFGGHQQHGQHLVDPAQAAGVDLHDVDRLVHDELLEQDAVLAHLAGRDLDLADAGADLARGRSTSSGLVGSSMNQGLAKASLLTQSIASSTSHTWLASIIRVRSGPSTSRAMRRRRMSSSRSRRPSA